MALAIIGNGGSGKDTAADLVRKITGLTFIGSTSWAVKEQVADAMQIDVFTAWETRRENRQRWKQIMDRYRGNDHSRIVREMVENGGAQIITGIRTATELYSAISDGYIENVIWVDRPGTTDPTNELSAKDAIWTVNNGKPGIEHLKDEVLCVVSKMELI